MNEINSRPSATIARMGEQAQDYAARARADNTLKAYRADWQHFSAWCEEHGRQPLPAEPATVADYLADIAGKYKASTLQRRLATISKAHKAAGYPSPTKAEEVSLVLSGIKRTMGSAQAAKAPATVDVIRAMVETLPDTLIGKRDRALLLVGFAGAFRRSELAALDVADMWFTVQGVVVTLRRSKTDQEGEGRKVAIPYGVHHSTCPVRSLATWLEAAGISRGPVFRPVDRHGNVGENRLAGHGVAGVVKRAAERAGLDAAQFGGHSLRAGLATSAAAAGVSERTIMQQTGHKSEAMVRRYIREGNLFSDNAAGKVGL